MQLAGALADSKKAAEILSGIGNLNDPNRVKALAGALSTGDWVVQSAAAIALGQSRQASALEPLLAVVTAESPNWWAVPAVVEALGQLGNPASIDGLRSLLDRAVVRLKSYQQDQARLNQLPQYARPEIERGLRNSELAITVIHDTLGKLGATARPSGR